MTPHIPESINTLDNFEEIFGVDVAHDLVLRVCEEVWSQGSQCGVTGTDITWHNRTNSSVAAVVEHCNNWYDVSMDNGDWNGTVVKDFSWSHADDVLGEDLAVDSVLGQYLSLEPEVAKAGYATLVYLRSKMKDSRKLSAYPARTHALLNVILGDLALHSQDYAVEAFNKAFPGNSLMPDSSTLFELLSPELQLRMRTAKEDIEHYAKFSTRCFFAAIVPPGLFEHLMR
jgi:hypothetical protein